MRRVWLVLVFALCLWVTDHGQFWMDDFSQELFPDDQISMVITNQLPGCSLECPPLGPAVLPVEILIPVVETATLPVTLTPPQDSPNPINPKVPRAHRSRPPPVLT